MQQQQFIDLQISSTCFGQFCAHLQERKTVLYSMWYNVSRLLSVGGLESGGTDCVFGVKDVARLSILHTEHTVRAVAIQASDRQQSGDIIPHALNHSLALLRMGKELPETC